MPIILTLINENTSEVYIISKYNNFWDRCKDKINYEIDKKVKNRKKVKGIKEKNLWKRIRGDKREEDNR